MPVTHAFVLRSVDYGESDRILTLFTKEMGRISAMARGVRKSRRRYAGVLEPFACFEVSLSLPKRSGVLYTITEATLLNSHAGLSTDLERLGTAAALVELVREIRPEEESDPLLFEWMREALGFLSAAETRHPLSVGFAAYLRILSLSGYGFSLDACRICNTEVPRDRSVYVNVPRGGVVCTPCGGGTLLLPGAAVTAFTLLNGATLDAAAGMSLDRSVCEQLDRLLDLFVQHHLEKELKTTMFRRQVAGTGQLRSDRHNGTIGP